MKNKKYIVVSLLFFLYSRQVLSEEYGSESCAYRIRNAEFLNDVFLVESQIAVSDSYMLRGPEAARMMLEGNIKNKIEFLGDIFEKYSYSNESRDRFINIKNLYEKHIELRKKYEDTLKKIDELESKNQSDK